MDKLRILLLLVVSTIFVTGSSSQALAFVIDFEDLTGGDVFNADDASQPYKDQIPGGPVGLGVRIYADNISQGGTQTSDLNAVPAPLLINHLDLSQLVATDLAVVFDSSADSLGVEPDLEDPFDYNGPLPDLTSADFPGNILIIQENPSRVPDLVAPGIEGGCEPPSPVIFNPPPTCVPDDEATRPNGQFIFEFTSPVAILSIDVFDVETDEDDPNEILFYDENGNLLGLFSDDNVQTTGGDNLWNQVPLNSIRVKTMIIEWPGSGAIDNIVYDIPVGGQILSMESTPLLIEGINTNSYSILGVLTMLGLAAFGALYYTSTRKN